MGEQAGKKTLQICKLHQCEKYKTSASLINIKAKFMLSKHRSFESKLCKCVSKLINFPSQKLGVLAPGKANTSIAVFPCKEVSFHI